MRGGGPSDQKQVWILRGDKPTVANIKIGVSDGSVSELVEGDVKEGDDVITDVSDGTGKPAGQQAGGPRFRGF
jgi:HlyD family secretion protein